MIKLRTNFTRCKPSTSIFINPQEISSIEEYSQVQDTGSSKIVMRNKTTYIVEETQSEINSLIFTHDER